MKVTAIIPCYDKHFNYLKNRLVELQTNTYKPEQVIVSLNGCNKIDKNLLKLIEIKFKNLFNNFFILKSDERLPRPKARNITKKYILNDIICLFDADDIIHPQRIEITKYFFEKYNISHLLNSYIISGCKKSCHTCLMCILGKPNQFKQYNDFEKIKKIFPNDLYNINFGEDFIKPGVKTILGHNGKYQILPHHGNCSFLKKVFDEIDFNTDYPRGQDSLFCQEVLYKFKNTMLIDSELCISDNQWIPEKKDFYYLEKQNIYLNFGAQTYPGTPRTEEEIKVITEKI